MSSPKLKAYQNSKLKAQGVKDSILDLLKSGESHSIKTLQEALSVGYSTITGRLSDLESEGLIFKTPKEHKGQAVWEITPAHLVKDLEKAYALSRLEAWKRQGEKFAEYLPGPISDYFK